MSGGEFRDHRVGEEGVGFRPGNRRRVDVGGDRDDLLTVLAPDGRRGRVERQPSHLAERHMAAPGRPDAVVLDVGDAVALLLGQADMDSDIFPAALQTHGFVAEERAAYLAGHVLEGQSQSPSFGA